LSISFFETVEVRVKTGEDDSDMDNEISESSSPVFTRTSTVSRKVMDNEIYVRVKPGEDDSDISLSITFLETVDVRVKTGEDDSDISLSITFLENLKSNGQ
jgi:hypothetical protein